jgi:hypothetical protein
MIGHETPAKSAPPQTQPLLLRQRPPHGGLRFEIKHPDYIDIPPLPEGEEQQEPSYVTVYNRAAVARFIALANIDSIEFKPARGDGE